MPTKPKQMAANTEPKVSQQAENKLRSYAKDELSTMDAVRLSRIADAVEKDAPPAIKSVAIQTLNSKTELFIAELRDRKNKDEDYFKNAAKNPVASVNEVVQSIQKREMARTVGNDDKAKPPYTTQLTKQPHELGGHDPQQGPLGSNVELAEKGALTQTFSATLAANTLAVQSLLPLEKEPAVATSKPDTTFSLGA